MEYVFYANQLYSYGDCSAQARDYPEGSYLYSSSKDKKLNSWYKNDWTWVFVPDDEVPNELKLAILLLGAN